MAAATPAASAPRHSPAALEARSLRGRCPDAARDPWPRRYTRPILSPLGCRLVRSARSIPARGRFHIGGGAYCVWAFPPTVGGTARHGQVHRHTTAALTTSKHFLLQCSAAGSLVLALPAPACRGPRTAGKRRAWTLPSWGGPHRADAVIETKKGTTRCSLDLHMRSCHSYSAIGPLERRRRRRQYRAVGL